MFARDQRLKIRIMAESSIKVLTQTKTVLFNLSASIDSKHFDLKPVKFFDAVQPPASVRYLLFFIINGFIKSYVGD